MSRRTLTVVALLLLGFGAGFVLAKARKSLVQAFEQGTPPVPTREVPASWRGSRLAPGHAVHVLNQGVKCDDCHDPTKATFDKPDPGVCSSCHTEQTSHWHTGGAEAPTDCNDCHSFKAADDIQSRWDCVRCHGPFQTAALPGLSMHTSMGCENCHNPHRPVEETDKECESCHEPVRVQHGKPAVSGSCIDCHGGHKLASEAAACMDCHATKRPTVPATAVFGGGHDLCASCHEPHAFSKRTALNCTSCHKNTVVLGQHKAQAHRKCSSCHDPHAVRESGDRTCAACHSRVKSTHPRVPNRGDCVSCHTPHPKRATQTALLCTHCHEEARLETAFHSEKTACTDCHTPHGFDLDGLSEQVLCSRCHAEQVRLTAKNTDHETCASCHQGTLHAPSGVAACGSCHGELLDESPKGHRDCTSCHEPHSGAVAAQTACTSCHKLQQLPGLHRVPNDTKSAGHTECTACHEMHVARVKADRATCMTCHKDIANHEPTAKRCTGCHTFRN